MFVNRIDIHEFRGIKSCKGALNLSKFVVLIGRNNAGKSSILEALSLLPYPKTNIAGYYLPALNKNKLDFIKELHADYSSLIYKYSGEAHIEYSANEKNVIIKIRQGDANITIDETEITLKSRIDKIQEAWNMDKEIRNAVLFIPNDTEFLRKLKIGLEQEFYKNEIIKNGAHVRVINDLINRCIDDKYTEILFAPDLQARKEVVEGSPYYVKIQDLGDGIEKVTLIALWLEVTNPKLILWDDLEASIHPTLIKTILEWLSKKNWQVALSTHSIDVLSSLLEVKPKDLKVIQLQKKPDDILLHQDLNIDELQDIFDANQDPRKIIDLLKL